MTPRRLPHFLRIIQVRRHGLLSFFSLAQVRANCSQIRATCERTRALLADLIAAAEQLQKTRARIVDGGNVRRRGGQP